MAEISAQSSNNSITEKRSGARRIGERRKDSGAKNLSFGERRVAETDRRVTIVNRLKDEVTDRRSLQ